MRAENYNRMKNVAESSGTVIFEHEGKLYIVRKPSQWTSTALFVTGLLTFIFLANGILQLFVFNKGSDKLSAAGIILSAAGVLFAFISWRIIALRKKINSLPPEKFKSICVIDLGSDNLLDENEKAFSLALGRNEDWWKREYPGSYQALSRVLVLPWNEFYTAEHVDFIAVKIKQCIADLSLVKTK